ncbi:MAG: hypothetical protein IT441_02850, partial [Phycisphaeraceae bacterium]|nr:hypothetical protein [Phycisphaeraceae bacterium]
DPGWLLAGGDEDPLATTMLTGGWDGPRVLPPTDLPWSVWRPTLLLWGSLALLVFLSGILLATVVHPQWARHELLPYPLARFVGELTARAPGSSVPIVLRSKLFWLAVGFVLFVHALNGLNAWQIPFIVFPRNFPAFLNARVLLPDAVAVNAPMAWAVFIPQLFFAVIGLSFFLRTEVSLSLGLVGAAYLAMASFMYANGQAVEYNVAGAGNSNLVVFGAWFAGAVVVLYVGRGYYAAVLRGMLGLPRAAETPPTVIWAARGLLLCAILATGLLVQAGLDWIIAVPLVLLVLMVLMMIARINAETGAFLLLPEWYPAAILLAVAGDAALGPTGYLLAGMVSAILVGEPTEAVTAMTANGLRMIDRAAETDDADSPIPHPAPPPTRLPRTPLAMLAAAAIAFAVLLIVVLTIQYNQGLNLDDKWATNVFPSRVPDVASKLVEELSARQQLDQSTAAQGWERLALLRPRPGALGWISLGAVLVLACAYARLRFAWWPLHPVVFMVMGTHPAMHLHYSFLLGWAIKASVVRLGGVRAARTVEPLMVGLIVGDILAMLIWALIGAAYYLSTGLYPPRIGTMLST